MLDDPDCPLIGAQIKYLPLVQPAWHEQLCAEDHYWHMNRFIRELTFEGSGEAQQLGTLGPVICEAPEVTTKRVQGQNTCW